LLFLFGRDAADLEITGPPEAIEALKRTVAGTQGGSDGG
jgi:hypothetical protein